jgi:tRNA(Ile2) C34 agmatinyltransferase TiaS
MLVMAKCEQCGGEMKQMGAFSACPKCSKKNPGKVDVEKSAEKFADRMLEGTPFDAHRQLDMRIKRLERAVLAIVKAQTTHSSMRTAEDSRDEVEAYREFEDGLK